jgi:hypothetical protein
MMKLSFWLTARTLASGVKMALTALDMNPEQLASAASKQGETVNPNRTIWSGAVAKVPPPVGSVKYKALPIVLSVQIPLFTGHSRKQALKIGEFAVEVSEDAQ